MCASPFVPARRKFTYRYCFPASRRKAICPDTMSSLEGALPVVHCHPPGSSSFEPSPKASSPEPEASVKVDRLGGGESQSRIRSPGPESSTRFPSISKLPTALPASVEALVRSARTAASRQRGMNFLRIVAPSLAVDEVVDPVDRQHQVRIDRRVDDDGDEEVIRLLVSAGPEPDEVDAVGELRLVEIADLDEIGRSQLILEVVRVEDAEGVRILKGAGQAHLRRSARIDLLGDGRVSRARGGDDVRAARKR